MGYGKHLLFVTWSPSALEAAKRIHSLLCRSAGTLWVQAVLVLSGLRLGLWGPLGCIGGQCDGVQVTDQPDCLCVCRPTLTPSPKRARQWKTATSCNDCQGPRTESEWIPVLGPVDCEWMGVRVLQGCSRVSVLWIYEWIVVAASGVWDLSRMSLLHLVIASACLTWLANHLLSAAVLQEFVSLAHSWSVFPSC